MNMASKFKILGAGGQQTHEQKHHPLRFFVLQPGRVQPYGLLLPTVTHTYIAAKCSILLSHTGGNARVFVAQLQKDGS
jgi:hypothetical protein